MDVGGEIGVVEEVRCGYRRCGQDIGVSLFNGTGTADVARAIIIANGGGVSIPELEANIPPDLGALQKVRCSSQLKR